jgi:hypothetical protein
VGESALQCLNGDPPTTASQQVCSSSIRQVREYWWTAEYFAGSGDLCAAEIANHGPLRAASRGETRQSAERDEGISNNLTYISRDGQLEIEDQDGQVIQGKDAVADLKAEWRDGGLPILADSTMRDAFHLVLSMPTRTDPLSV